VSNQIQVKNNYDLVNYAKSDFDLVAVNQAIKWEKEFNFAVQAIEKNSYLEKIAWSNQTSLKNAIVNISAIGISLNPASKHAYLVPREGMICLDISYMGLLHLAQKGGGIAWGQAKIVYANDSYMNKGIDKQPAHEYQAFGDRGQAVGVYCTVKTPAGDYLTEEMSISDVYQIRDRSMAYKKKKAGPWATDEGEMIKKTVVKRASKYWPPAPALDEAIRVLNEESGEGIDFEEEQKPAEKKKGNWHAGAAPTTLPEDLRIQYFLIREAFDIEDFQMVSEMFAEFELIEEKNACWKCFASDERTKMNKFGKSDDYIAIVNPELRTFLSGDELDAFLDKWNH